MDISNDRYNKHHIKLKIEHGFKSNKKQENTVILLY